MVYHFIPKILESNFFFLLDILIDCRIEISVCNNGGSGNVDPRWFSKMGKTAPRMSRNTSTFNMRHIFSTWTP